jgi:hypothetical protein
MPASSDRLAAAADQHDGAVHARDLLHLPDEVRIDLPIGPVVPCDVMGADRMADEEILHFAAAIDEDGRRILVQEFNRFGGLQVLHDGESSRAAMHRYALGEKGYNRSPFGSHRLQPCSPRRGRSEDPR